MEAPDDFLKPFDELAGFDVQLALEAGEIGTWDWDLAGGSMRWSLQMFRNMGVDPSASGDLYGHLLAAIHPTDRDDAIGAFDEFRRRPGPMRIEVRLVWPADERRWVVFLGKVTADDKGAPTRMSGITIDSTRRRQNEETSAAALSESEQRLRELSRRLQERVKRRGRQLGASRAQMQAIFDNSPDWLTLFRATADGRFVYEDLNRATERAYGFDYDQIVGRTVEEILGIEQAQLPLSRMRACIETGENQRYTARRTMAGITRSIDVMFVRVPERHEGDYFIMSTARDTTERDEIEERLRQSQKIEAVGQLTGGVAHDFNNLLTIILGNLEGARRLSANGEAELQESLAAIDRAGQRAATLTHRLLAFSRHQPLAPRTLDLNRLVSGMSDLFQRTIGEVVTIEVVLGARLWLTRVDSNQLENALLNLVLNARDAMQRGGKLTIETANLYLDDDYTATDPEVPSGQYVLLAVTDTGTGMTEEVRLQAFDPFFTTKPMGQGSGLGLSMVYGFARQSGGHVRIYSELGNGTTIKLYLPRWFGELDEPHAERSIGQHLSMENKELILVVEDDAEVRAYAVRALRRLGYQVLEAGRADAALAQLRDQRIDLLFTDIGLPDVDGRQLANRARLLQPGLKVLFTTGYARSAIVHNGTLDADIDFIPKPFSSDALARIIRQILDRSDGTDKAR